MKAKILLLSLVLCSLVLGLNSCSEDGTCSDGKQNQGERGIDCGDDAGLCPPCGNIPDCFDGIQNGGELGVDCGGPCAAQCAETPTCTDGVQNGDEEGIDCGGSCPTACDIGGGGDTNMTLTLNGVTFDLDGSAVAVNDSTLSMSGTSGADVVSLEFIGVFEASADNSINNAAMSISGTICNDLVEGLITFTTFDMANQTVSGTYSFNCLGDTVTGTFTNLPYN